MKAKPGFPIAFILLFLSLCPSVFSEDASVLFHKMQEALGGAAVARSSGGFFFVWTLFALGVTALFSLILAVRGLSR